MNHRKYTVRYAAVQAFYWAIVCAVMGFGVAYMLDKGYTNSEIGVIMAVSNILAVFLQPMMASLADRNRKLTLKRIVWGLTICALLVSTGLLFTKEASAAVTVFMAVSMIGVTAIHPFLNAMSVKLEEQGIVLNFGLCRAGGSISYAVMSTIIGILIEKYSFSVVPAAAVLLLAGLFVSAGVFGSMMREDVSSDADAEDGETEEAKSLYAFLSQNKRFAVFLVGVILLFYTHTITSNYLIQLVEHVGGNSSHMGIASSVAAVVELPAMIFFIKIVKRIRVQTLLRIAGGFYAVKFLCFFLADSVGMIYAAQLFQCGSYALFLPASVHYVSRLFSKSDMIKGQSLLTTAMTLGTVFASVIGGWILDAYGTEDTMLVALIVALTGVVLMAGALEETK